jgi:hypothetical protein
MHYIALLILLALPAAAMGGVYKWTDAEGNVVYSDEPRPGAEQITVPEVSTYTPAPLLSRETDAPQDQEAISGYEKFQIVEPGNEATLRDSPGNVQVTLLLVPPLRQGDQIIVSLDGASQSQLPLTSTQFTLQNVDRGTHTLKATVVDNAGQAHAETQTVTFYLHRQSINFPRGPTPP